MASHVFLQHGHCCSCAALKVPGNESQRSTAEATATGRDGQVPTGALSTERRCICRMYLKLVLYVRKLVLQRQTVAPCTGFPIRPLAPLLSSPSSASPPGSTDVGIAVKFAGGIPLQQRALNQTQLAGSRASRAPRRINAPPEPPPARSSSGSRGQRPGPPHAPHGYRETPRSATAPAPCSRPTPRGHPPPPGACGLPR